MSQVAPQEAVLGRAAMSAPAADDRTAALRRMVFDGRYDDVHRRVRAAVERLDAIPASDETHASRAGSAYGQLRAVLAELGSAREIVADPQTLFALFDWSAIHAPDLFPILSGHFNLTVGAIERLGTGSEEQQLALAQLDDAASVGVFLLTELGFGSNVLELETEAVWDRRARRFVLHTPSDRACKFMPNVGARDLPTVTVVAARLKVDGRDEGVFSFLVPLRTSAGRAPGVHVTPLPDKGYIPMDNAVIRFDRVQLPFGCWLPAGIARIDDDGDFSCRLPRLQDRFLHAIGQLQGGRLALAAGSIAAARASLWLTYRYALQRRTAGGVPMIDRDNVAQSLVSATARVYAATALANALRARFAAAAHSGGETDRGSEALLHALAKPLLSSTALAVQQECRERCGAQGMFRANRIPDYIGLSQGVVTAEGENQVLRVSAGRGLAGGARAEIAAGDTIGSEWTALLRDRGRALAAQRDPVAPSSHAIELADAAAARLAAEALDAAAEAAEPAARDCLRDLADLFGAEQVQRHAGWHAGNDTLSPERAGALPRRLRAMRAELAPLLPELLAAFALDDDQPRSLIGGDYVGAWIETVTHA